MSTDHTKSDNHVAEPPLWEELFPSEYATVAGWVVLIVSVLFIVMGTIPQMMYGYPKSPNELGDTFGVVNALFSGLGFAGLLITILIQIRDRRHLAQQHRENVLIQERISDQQNLAVLVTAISTLTDLDQSFDRLTNDEANHGQIEQLATILVNRTTLERVISLHLKNVPINPLGTFTFSPPKTLIDIYLDCKLVKALSRIVTTDCDRLIGLLASRRVDYQVLYGEIKETVSNMSSKIELHSRLHYTLSNSEETEFAKSLKESLHAEWNTFKEVSYLRTNDINKFLDSIELIKGFAEKTKSRMLQVLFAAVNHR